MLYVSTRGGAPAVNFAEAAARGLAPDGGLYVPESFPDHSVFLKSSSNLGYARFAEGWLAPLTSGLSAADLARCCNEAWADFPRDNPAPIVRLSGDLAVLELFHGPTQAFKDFALRFLGRVQAVRARETGEQITVLGATSGDTGAAAVHAVPAEAGRCVILYPLGRVAPLAERQMLIDVPTHCRALALEGDFDACQSIVKELMGDPATRVKHHLAAVNSINIARILAQSVYYAWACVRLGDEAYGRGVRVVVPSGNFGNALAADFARRMGAPIREIVAATNANDTIARYFATGEYRPGATKATLAPAMDISKPSNFERWLWLRLGRDGSALKAALESATKAGVWRDPAPRDPVFSSTVMPDDKIPGVIGEVYAKFKYVLDPHTACAFAAPVPTGGPITLVASTAHPAKFPETLVPALGFEPTHPALERLKSAPLNRTVLPATPDAVKAWLAANS
jgi:threonine synthase